MKMNKINMKRIMLCITYAVLLLFLIMNFSSAWSIFTNFIGIIMPFVYGFVIAYILKFPYEFFRKKAFGKMGTKHKFFKGFKVPLSLVCTYVIAFGVVAFLLGILIPQIVASVLNIVENMNDYIAGFQEAENNIITLLNSTFGLELRNETLFDTLFNGLSELMKKYDIASMAQSLLSSAFPAIVDVTKNTTVEIYNWVIGIIVSVYYLACKDKLCSQATRLTKAYVPEKFVDNVFYITNLSNNMCGKFLIGKILDSAIIGIICFICMSIFHFDYALLISVIIGFTNIIPFFGPFIGAIPSAVLLLLVDPVQCFWFVLFIIVLQQVDGNVIGPKILGESVGVSGFWIMVSVIIGGGLFGVAGMVLGVPVFAVIYTLISNNVKKRLKGNDEEEETAEETEKEAVQINAESKSDD